jgi:hypothetical protein
MEAKILDASGCATSAAKEASKWAGFVEPKGSHPYFGWIDMAGDPATVRVDLVAGVARDARTGRFMIILSQAGMAPSISDRDAFRLFKRLGWTVPEPEEARPQINSGKSLASIR